VTIEPQNLTPAARMALLGADFRAGSELPHDTTLRVAAELAWHGLICTEATLTYDGAIVRARIIDSTMEAMEA
jgi:hypothetical protein